MRYLLPALFFLLCTRPCAGQKLPDNPKTLLWAVINAKGDTSYLFGTFHEFGMSYFRQYPRPKKLMNDADMVYLEQSLDKAGQKAPKAQNWLTYLSKEEYEMLDKHVKALGYDDLNFFKRAQPYEFKYFLGSYLLAKVVSARDSLAAITMEEYMYDHRRFKKKKVAGLEVRKDVDSTLRFVSQELGSNDSTIVRNIVDLVRNESLYADSIRMSEAYREAIAYRNADINYRFSVSSIDEDPGFAYALDKRNMDWMPAIKSSIDTQRTFIAVGMRHLWYKKGLINLLLDAGYKVLPVAMK